jgi:YVTN family beta-propeller protein
MTRWLIPLTILGILTGWVPAWGDAAAGPAHADLVIKRASSAIAITADGATLLVVNSDSNTLSLVKLDQGNSVTEIPVGMDPRTVAVDDDGRRAYVANRGSASVTVVDLTARKRVAEIATGYRPYGVVASPDGARIFVAEQGANRVRIVDTRTLTTVALIPTRERPSGLAITDDARMLYVTHLLSNALTAIALQPRALYLPLLIEPATTPILTDARPGTPTSNFRPPTSDLQLPTSDPQLRTSPIPLWPSSNLVQSIVIAPDGRRAWVPHTRSNAANRALTFDTTVFPVVTPVDLSAGRLIPSVNIALDVVDQPVGLPFDAAFTPDGREIWIVNAASNDVSVVDLSSLRRVAHIAVGDAPRGIVMSPDGQVVYVNNTLAGTVSVIDAAAYTVSETVTVTRIPLPPALLLGKRLFNTSADPRMGKLRWIACNTCHFDGETDGQTWFFSFAGPRNTTSLLGMNETYPLRWSGEWDESADSEYAIRRQSFGTGLIDGAMNCALSPADCAHQPPNQGRSYDLDALALYLDSLAPAPSPYPMDTAAQRGQAIFANPDTRCAECHPAPLYTDLKPHDVGTTTSDERIGPAYDTPTLRGLWGSAPYLHDGSAATLHAVLTSANPSDAHGVTSHLTAQEIDDLIAFMLALPGK